MQYVLAQVIYLAAEAEEPEGIDLVIPEMNELIAGIIAFSIVFLVVWRWGRPAINRALEARQDAITGQQIAQQSSERPEVCPAFLSAQYGAIGVGEEVHVVGHERQ